MINLLTAVKQMIFRVAIYIRLSKEDLEKKDSREESYSVQNQKLFLENYVKEQGYTLVDIYIDDGYTGTNFNRPAFKRMISDIESGKIDMVVTKDLSRLGRDYIGTGEYVEKYFPLHNIRYVSVLDGIDTFLNTSNNDIAPFKAVINDMYSRDNSKKIKTALESLQKEGKWVGGCTPLGYKPDPDNKNHLVINEDEAYIIRKIFDYALKGLTDYQIKEKLIEEKIPTASMLRKKHKTTYMANQGIWSTKTIYTILRNQIYTGDLVQNKRSRINYKVRKLVPNDKCDWIIVENKHEPIIDKKTFEAVQKLLENRRVKPKKDIYRLLDGLLYCGECGHKITVCKPRKSDNRTYTVCNTYRMYSKQKLCTSHSNNYDLLEEEILNNLKSIFKETLDKEKISKRLKDAYEKGNTLNDYRSRIDTIDNLISLKQEHLDKMYIDKLDSKITEEMYIRIKTKMEEEMEKHKKEKSDLEEIVGDIKDDKVINEECARFVKEFLSVENPSKSLILRLIKRIEIHQDKQVDIHFNFKQLNFLLEKKSS